jgi:transposase
MANTNKSEQTEKNKHSRAIKRRRRWSVFEKLQIVEESKSSSETICSVARKNEIAPSLLYFWRYLERNGKLKAFNAGVKVVPASSVKRLQSRIYDLESLLEKKNKEIEILRAKISEKPIIKNLEKYPLLKMAIKYDLFGDVNL